MSARTFSPMLTRRATPGAAKAVARPAPAVRTAGARAGVPRFASAPRRNTAASASAAAPVAKSSLANRPMSRRNDRWEGEARRISEQAVRSPAAAAATVAAAPAVVARAPVAAPRRGPPAPQLGPRELPALRNAQPTGPPRLAPMVMTAPLADVTTAGQPLAPALRHRMEALLGIDLRAVRVHTGPAAHQAAEGVSARAFTVGTHIYLGAGENPADLVLLAHEVAHVVQQSATLHASHPRGPPQIGGISPAPGGMIQREESEEPGIIDSVVGVVSSAADTVSEVVAEGFWAVVDRLAPQEIANLLHEIRDQGFLGMLRSRISSALDFVFAALRAQGGTMAEVANFFESLLNRVRPIMSALAEGNCEPLFAAVRSLGEMLGQMAGNVWDRITTFLQPIGDWLSNVWQKFGAPVVDFLKEFASDTWDWIKNVGERLWDLTKPVRDFYSGAWTEIKNLLGFGEGSDTDGSAGVVGWISTKAGELWDEIKTELRPVIEPIQQAASAISDFLPLTAILNLRDRITEWTERATAMADNMDAPDDVAENQDLLRDIILPGIRRAITSLRGKVTEAQTWVTGKVGGLVTKVTDFCSSLSSNSLLSPFARGIQWISDEATAIGDFANNKVCDAFGVVDNALVTLDSWLEPICQMLQRLLTALGDLMGHLGDLVLGPLLLVPKCIRDPIKDFIVERILKQIPVFSELLALPDIWAKVQPACRAIIVQVFRDGDLFRAAWTFFRTVLTLLDVPPQLVTNLIRNAAKAIRDVLRDPIGFLGNVLTAMKQGLLQFIDHIGKHLLDGAINWLLSGVKGPGIRIPDPFTINLRNVLDLVCQVIDLTKEKVFQRIEKKKGKEVADKVRKIVAAGEKVIEWVTILFNEGPAGLWKHLQTELSNLWGKLLDMVIDFLIGKIVQQATLWVTKTLASGGLSVIIDAIKAVYDALQVLAQYLRQLLEVANSVCEGIIDIAKGVLGKAADMVENAAARLIPAVLAFLARTLGIGDLPQVIGEGIQKVRTTVEGAIDKLIEKTFAAIDWAKQKGKEALAALREWWKARKEFTVDGEKHAVYLQGTESGAVLMVASTAMNFESYVSALKVPPKNAAKVAAKAQAVDLAKKIDKEVKAAAADKPATTTAATPAPADHALAIADLLAELSQVTATLMSDSDWEESSPIVFGPQVSGYGTSASIERLTKKHQEGQAASGAPDLDSWNYLRQRLSKTGKSTYYVRGHLLNEKLGGPASWANLTPITQEANNRSSDSMLHEFEKAVKEKVNKKKTPVAFSVTVNYGQPSRTADIAKAKTKFSKTKADLVEKIMLAEMQIPRSLDCRAFELDENGVKTGAEHKTRTDNAIALDAESYEV